MRAYKHGTYELPHELLSDFRLSILGNWEISGKGLNFIQWYSSVQSSCHNENFADASKKPLKIKNQHFPIVHYFSWKLELVLDIL